MVNLVRKLQDFNINGQMGMYLSGRMNLENGEFVYSDIIEDSYWNYINDINVDTKEEFIEVWEKCKKIMQERNRIPTLYVLPTSNVFNNTEILPEKFEEIYTDLWMVLKDTSSFNKIDNTNFKIEITNNKELFANTLVNGFRSDDPEDPYGVMPDYYRIAIYNSFESSSDYKKLNYIVKDGNVPIALATAIIKDDTAGIYNVATIRKYRNKGVCKALMNKVFSELYDKDVKTIFLQTEKDSYVEKFYNKLGFEGMFIGKAFAEKSD